jgi:hypothetical protein
VEARLRAIRTIAVLGLLVLAPAAARAQDSLAVDSLRVTNELGLVSDYTNQVWYEQTFDSTVVTGRVSVADPRARVVAEAVTRVLGAKGPFLLDAWNTFGVGNTVLREAARARGTARVSETWRARLDGELDARRDDTFDTRREDRRAALGASALWTSPVRATAGRVFARTEGLRSARGTLALFPDYDWRQVGLELDRFGVLGHASAVYAYGTRSFPDTSVRDYREHTLALDGRWSLSDPLRLELNAYAERRSAQRDSAVGDRFRSADAELGLVVRRGEMLEFGPRLRVRGQAFDRPTPTFFDAWIWRYAAVVRFLPDELSRLEFRPEVEFLRTPHFGGLPEGATREDRNAVANEEYDQLGLACEAERIGTVHWWWGTLTGGHRKYVDDGADPNDLSSRTSFWWVEVSAFGERRLTERLRLRASADARSEFHRLSSDDLVSLDLALDLRVRL